MDKITRLVRVNTGFVVGGVAIFPVAGLRNYRVVGVLRIIGENQGFCGWGVAAFW